MLQTLEAGMLFGEVYDSFTDAKPCHYHDEKSPGLLVISKGLLYSNVEVRCIFRKLTHSIRYIKGLLSHEYSLHVHRQFRYVKSCLHLKSLEFLSVILQLFLSSGDVPYCNVSAMQE